MSITEVAKLAGFSHATVSRVLNGRAGVSGEAEAAVRKAMRELGYNPSGRRPGPKPKDRAGLRNGTIALLMLRTEAMLVRAPVTAAALHGVEKALADADVNLVVGQVQDDDRLPPTVANEQVDGLLLHGFLPSKRIITQFANIPSVWLMSPRDPTGYFGNRVSPDNEAIGRLAAEYLIAQGHTHLAYLYCDPGHHGFELRKSAFVHTAKLHGVQCDVIEQGQPATQDVIHATPERFIPVIDKLLKLQRRPTGVFVPRDRATVIVHRMLQQRGIDLTRDIELVSCDNDPVLSGLNPLPATIDINPELIGREAVALLLREIHSGDGHSLRQRMLVEPRLIRPEEHPSFVPELKTRSGFSHIHP